MFHNRKSSRPQYRKLHHAVKGLIETDGDICTLCRAPFAHGAKTFLGETKARQPAVVCAGCASRPRRMIGCGLYIGAQHANNYPDLFCRGGTAPDVVSPQAAMAAVDLFQQYIADTDALANDIARRGGLPPGLTPQIFCTETTAWKTDDARWFAAHPTRSHRVRAVSDEEIVALDQSSELKPGYRRACIVRQIEPGMRLRYIFNLTSAFEIPDIEEVLHALLDKVMRNGDLDLDLGAVAELARQYAASAVQPQ